MRYKPVVTDRPIGASRCRVDGCVEHREAISTLRERQHGWAGSYLAVRRLVADIRSQLPLETACRLDVMTLAHSRHQYVEFVWGQTVATWLGCHRRHGYAECAKGYGFKIDPCPPHDPQKKGIVESGVKYPKGNCLPLREFRDLADLNAQARAWVLEEAGVRCHDTTRLCPSALWPATSRRLRSSKSSVTTFPRSSTWERRLSELSLAFQGVVH